MIFALLFLLFIISSECAGLSSQASPSSETEVSKNFSETRLSVNFWVFLSEQYEPLELDLQDKVLVDISFNLTVPPIVQQSITMGIPFSLNNVSGLPEGASYTYGFWGYPPRGILTINLPAYTSNSSIRLEGNIPSKSVLWRNSVEIPALNVTSSLTGASFPNLILVPPAASRFLRVYSQFYPGLSYQKATIEGLDSLVISNAFVPIVILYEPAIWQTYAFVTIFIIIFSAYAVLYTTKWRIIFEKTSKLVTRLSAVAPAKISTILSTLYSTIKKIDATKLLTIYMSLALLMISLSFLAGPDPRLKVYVLSSTSANANAISDFVAKQVEGVSITVFDEMSEFDTLSNLGVFEAVVVGDFSPPTRQTVDAYIFPGLDSVNRIIVVKEYAPSGFLSELQTRYVEKTTIVNDLPSLEPALLDVHMRANALGLPVNISLYESVSAFVGLSSLFLVFFGLAFLSAKLIEAGTKPLISGFVEAILFSVFVFFFNETIYIACSVLLAMPVGLHTGSPKVTALGFIGFGGGTQPRLIAGLAGFLFGTLVSLKHGLKLDKIGFMSFLWIVIFVMVDPLTSGIIFYEIVLLLTVGPDFGTASTTLSYVKEFLSSGGLALGGWVSPTYALSTGIILYFAGAIPFCLFPKLRKSTATFLLLLSSFAAADGGVRIANMRPWMTVACILPGIAIGLFFCVLFYAINTLEIGLRARFKA